MAKTLTFEAVPGPGRFWNRLIHPPRRGFPGTGLLSPRTALKNPLRFSASPKGAGRPSGPGLRLFQSRPGFGTSPFTRFSTAPRQ
jgi:hypothetical protein